MLWLCFKLPSYLFGNTRDTSVIHEKAKFVCFIYMKPQKMKFNFVQINMKPVSYFNWIHCTCSHVSVCGLCLFLTVPLVGLWSVIVVFLGYTHLF